jgi:hypothetical protein
MDAEEDHLPADGEEDVSPEKSPSGDVVNGQQQVAVVMMSEEEALAAASRRRRRRPGRGRPPQRRFQGLEAEEDDDDDDDEDVLETAGTAANNGQHQQKCERDDVHAVDDGMDLRIGIRRAEEWVMLSPPASQSGSPKPGGGRPKLLNPAPGGGLLAHVRFEFIHV